MKTSRISPRHWTRRWLAPTLIACGLAVALPAQADILIGQTTSVTGPVAASVGETLVGVRAYLDHVNAQGGIHGEKIKLITLDDNFKPPRAAENAKKLIEQDNVVALFMSRATPHTEAILPLLAQHKLALVAPSTGAMVFHTPVNPYVFNVRSSYQAETERAIRHLHEITLERVAVVHVDDSFGADCLAGAMKGFAAAGKQPVAVIKADREKPDYAAIVKTLIDKQAQAVLWIGSSVAVSGGVKALRQAGSAAQVLTVSNNASAGFIKQLGEHAHGVVVTQVFPSERALGVPINREALALLKGKGELSPQVMEGFASAKVLVEALRRAGPSPTRAKVIDALNSINHLNLGGLELGFSPTDHTGLNYVELSIIGRNGKFQR
ncbi:ABC transporter substrate-binding protein [Ottowia sp. GY511]|uniref:ABC transporter substrate-binding protein n=1 Tax=Ottowia flava TaxID=2675430 RepID=A0ABW4KR58_9BURK|nr:ABC transporter substrate-binding protein [Ottowia sp. GY511]TXK33064.1 ABC transporter substrate-binding protein [Ottowia sp. GY511]